MDELDFNSLLSRTEAVRTMQETLENFQKNKKDLLQKRGLYIYGEPGTGKTSFVMRTLKKLGYDVVRYDAGDIRNKNIIETITKHNISDKSVISMFSRQSKPIAIVMDEIDGMNNGDKGGINSLIKLIRPKKTKKQKEEDVSYNPIICISNYHIDKKIKELIKVCVPIELKSPTPAQMHEIVGLCMPGLDRGLVEDAVCHLQGDLRKLEALHSIYQGGRQGIINSESLATVFRMKSHSEDTKDTTKRLINNRLSISEHAGAMNETDRTIVGLLWHENIVDMLGKQPHQKAIPFYGRMLQEICYADYIDRVTFQKQIWQFNEMSSLIKTMHPNKMYHDAFPKKGKYSPTEVRFTKVLTKYSTEYNNSVFVQGLCEQLAMDRKDMFAMFLDMREKSNDDDIYALMDAQDISKLDVNRMYRYLDAFLPSTHSDDEEASVISETA